MSCSLAYKKVSKEVVIFGYDCSTLESLIFDSEKLKDSLVDYCRETNKKMETKMLITPFNDVFIFEIKIIKNEA